MQLWFLMLMAAGCLADPSKYERVPGHGNYIFSRELKTWFEAKKACEDDGASLAVINNYAEAMALRGIFARYPGVDIVAHVGFHDLDQEGVYSVVTGGTLSNHHYNIWKNPPTGSARNHASDCGGMSTCGRLTDIRCSERHPFFCELA